MKVIHFRSLGVIIFCIAYSNGFSLTSIFGGGTAVDTAEGVPPEGLEDAKKPIKIILKPHKPEIVKPHKPVKPVVIKPVEKPYKPIKIKKELLALKVQKIKKLKELKDIKKKKISLFSHLALPFFSLHKTKSNKIKNKLQKIVPTKTEYVEVTKKIIVHPVCYITLKPKKPCIKLPHHGKSSPLDETYDERQNLEVVEEMGDIDDEDDDWLWSGRNAKAIKDSFGNITETDEEGFFADDSTEQGASEENIAVFDDVQASDADAPEEFARISYTVDMEGEPKESEEEEDDDEEDRNDVADRLGRFINFVDSPAVEIAEVSTVNSTKETDSKERYNIVVTAESANETKEVERKGRYINFVEPAAVEASESSESLEDLESSEDVDPRFVKLNWQTKTVLVTRVERYTNAKVTGTLIAKNCAPVNPHVPKCKKKFHQSVVIRDRPDGNAPLQIVSTPVLADVPPQIVIQAKEIVNDSASEEAKTVVKDTKAA